MSEFNDWKLPNTFERLMLCLSKPYTKLNYFNEPLEGEELNQFVSALATNKTLTVLSLQYNQLGDAGAQQLFHALQSSRTILSVGARDNRIGDAGAGAIAKFLRSNSSLTALSLCDNLIGSPGIIAIGKALEENTALLGLDLKRNAALDKGVIAFAGSLAKNQSLTRLDLDQVGCGDSGALALSKMLENNKSLRSLSLEENEIGDDGVQWLGQALESNETLCMLNLYANVDITDAGVDMMIQALRENYSITQINVAGISQVTQYLKLRLHQALDRNANLQRTAFAQALGSEETSAWGRSKLMVVGEGGVGKTATVRSLLGESFRPEWVSTVGLEITEAKTRVGMKWKTEDSKEYTATWVNKLAALKLAKHQIKPEEAGHDDEEEQEEEEVSVDTSKRAETQVSAGQSNMPLSNAKGQGLRFNRASFLEVLNDRESIQLQILDYGGQEVFHGLHHVLLSNYGIYLLVVDSRKLLNGTGEEARNSLEFWLKMIEVHAPEAPILVAGTFWDQGGSQNQAEIALERLNLHLRAESSFFPVDNQSQNGLAALRNRVEAVARKQDFVQLPVSIKWMMCLDTMLEAPKPWLGLAEVMEIASDLEVARGEVEPMLKLFHEFGTVFYFASTQSLKEIVTTNPQWLIDAIGSVVRDKDIHPFDEAGIDRVGLRSDFTLFQQQAIVSRDLLEFLWKRTEVDFLLDFMKSILLISRWSFGTSEEMYLVPSMVNKSNSLPPIAAPQAEIAFDYLPDGIFERLVCLCVEYSSAMKQHQAPQFEEGSCVLWLGKTTKLALERSDNSILAFAEPEVTLEWCLRVLQAFLRRIKETITKGRLKYNVNTMANSLQSSVQKQADTEYPLSLDQFLNNL